MLGFEMLSESRDPRSDSRPGVAGALDGSRSVAPGTLAAANQPEGGSELRPAPLSRYRATLGCTPVWEFPGVPPARGRPRPPWPQDRWPKAQPRLRHAWTSPTPARHSDRRKCPTNSIQGAPQHRNATDLAGVVGALSSTGTRKLANKRSLVQDDPLRKRQLQRHGSLDLESTFKHQEMMCC